MITGRDIEEDWDYRYGEVRGEGAAAQVSIIGVKAGLASQLGLSKALGQTKELWADERACKLIAHELLERSKQLGGYTTKAGTRLRQNHNTFATAFHLIRTFKQRHGAPLDCTGFNEKD